MHITDSIVYIGVNDHDIDLFEGQYDVDGISYNSYVILDEKTAVFDTADQRMTGAWISNLTNALEGRTPDYIVISHMEPDHSASLDAFFHNFPDTKAVGNAKTFQMADQFFPGLIPEGQRITVKENEELSLGSHTLVFCMAPMVHWPEVMVTYEKAEQVLFSADAFGRFGALPEQKGKPDILAEYKDGSWDAEARRYYLNIVGKYGAQAQGLLKKASALEIKRILPLHGPALSGDLSHYINCYQLWSSYTAEKQGVLIAFAGVYGHTAAAADALAEKLREKGVEVLVLDLARTDPAEALAQAFVYDRLVAAATTYDAGIYPTMEEFLIHLKGKAYQNRRVGIIENGTWAPMSGKLMKAYFEGMKNIELLEPMVTIKSALNEESEAALSSLADALSK